MVRFELGSSVSRPFALFTAGGNHILPLLWIIFLALVRDDVNKIPLQGDGWFHSFCETEGESGISEREIVL